MIEHPVQNHPHSHGMGFIHQFLQILFGSERRVNGVIINRVILVAGIRAENGRHVEDIHPKLPKMIQMVDDTPQVAVEIIPEADGFFVPECIGNLPAAGKPGREDLIDNLILRPPRRCKAFFLPQVLGAVKHLVNIFKRLVGKNVIGIEYGIFLRIHQFKPIAQAQHINGQFRFPIIQPCVPGCHLHCDLGTGVHNAQGNVFVLIMQNNRCQILLCRLNAE